MSQTKIKCECNVRYQTQELEATKFFRRSLSLSGGHSIFQEAISLKYRGAEIASPRGRFAATPQLISMTISMSIHQTWYVKIYEYLKWKPSNLKNVNLSLPQLTLLACLTCLLSPSSFFLHYSLFQRHNIFIISF